MAVVEVRALYWLGVTEEEPGDWQRDKEILRVDLEQRGMKIISMSVREEEPGDWATKGK